MKATTRLQPRQRYSSSAAETGSRAHEPAAAQFADNRSTVAGQCELADTIDASSYIATQRKRVGSMFGQAAQLRPEEDELQMKAAPELLQRQGPVEDEPLQAKSGAAQRQEESAREPNRTGLPDSLKSGIESLSGMSMSGVRVHFNSSRPAGLNALAYTQGMDIHMAPGQERHLPHEAWHVVQQAQGRVQPTMQLQAGVPVNDDASLEHEADVMGARAAATVMQASNRSERAPRRLREPASKSESGASNAAVTVAALVTGRVSQRTGDVVVQRMKYANCEAKFRTDNETEGEIANSEYRVTANGYERYAPINRYRAPSQFFHEGDKTFMYFADESKQWELYDKIVGGSEVEADRVGEAVTFYEYDEDLDDWTPMDATCNARWRPQDGLHVLDCHMQPNGIIEYGGLHPGHAVEDLGADLPELDKKDKVQELRILQRWMKYILSTGQLKVDQQPVGEEQVMSVFNSAHDSGDVDEGDWENYERYRELLDDVFGALEAELNENWWFWTK